MVNRAVDYGFNWAFYKQDIVNSDINNENRIFRQIQYFYEKDKNKKGYIKALYLHHLLDFFKETHVNINDINLVFEKFLQNKVILEIADAEGNRINFQEEIEEIFNLLKDNKGELYKDLKGEYLDDV
ncbi:MAG: hypothetical protein ACFFDY_06030 [Candidatus Thorarchaeota archaeon]